MQPSNQGVESRSSDQGRGKNAAFAISASLPTRCLPLGFDTMRHLIHYASIYLLILQASLDRERETDPIRAFDDWQIVMEALNCL